MAPQEAPADLQFGHHSPHGPQVAALVPSVSPGIAWPSGHWAFHLGSVFWSQVPCGLLLRTRVTSGAPACALWASQGLRTLSCFLCLLPEAVGQRTCLGPTILEFLSQPSPLLTSEPAWCFNGSLHVDLEKHRMRIQSINLTLGLEGPFSSCPPGPGSPA